MGNKELLQDISYFSTVVDVKKNICPLTGNKSENHPHMSENKNYIF